jgi:O-antigen/teichoic acid export membrane protein
LAIQVPGIWKTKGSAILLKAGLSSDSSSLTGKILRNASWITFGYGAEIIIRFFSSLILTRLLDPSAYGLISTVMVFMTVSVMFSELGLRQIVLTSSRVDESDFLNTIWTMQILRGLGITIILGLVALGWSFLQKNGTIAPQSAYGNPLLPPLLAVICFGRFLSAFESVNIFRLTRHLDQGPITKMDLVNRVVTTGLTVLFTLWLHSVWGIALALAVGALFRTFSTFYMLPGPPMKLRFDLAEIKMIVTKSRWIAVDSALSVLITQGDKVLLGYAFGLGILGLYSVALNITSAVDAIVQRMQSSMGIAVLSQLNDRPIEEQHRAYYRFRRPFEFYAIAFGVGFTLLGPWFFQLVYDPRYAQSGLYAAFLGAGLMLTPLSFSINFAIRGNHFKYLSFTAAVRAITFCAAMAAAYVLKSPELAVIAVTLQRLPEYIVFFLLPRGGAPFRWSRDGLLIGLSLGCIAFRLFI